MAKFLSLPIIPKGLWVEVDGSIGFVVRGEGNVTAKIIHAAKDLKMIGRSGAGYNNPDIAAATTGSIPVVLCARRSFPSDGESGSCTYFNGAQETFALGPAIKTADSSEDVER